MQGTSPPRGGGGSHQDTHLQQDAAIHRAQGDDNTDDIPQIPRVYINRTPSLPTVNRTRLAQSRASYENALYKLLEDRLHTIARETATRVNSERAHHASVDAIGHASGHDDIFAALSQAQKDTERYLNRAKHERNIRKQTERALAAARATIKRAAFREANPISKSDKPWSDALREINEQSVSLLDQQSRTHIPHLNAMDGVLPPPLDTSVKFVKPKPPLSAVKGVLRRNVIKGLAKQAHGVTKYRNGSSSSHTRRTSMPPASNIARVTPSAHGQVRAPAPVQMATPGVRPLGTGRGGSSSSRAPRISPVPATPQIHPAQAGAPIPSLTLFTTFPPIPAPNPAPPSSRVPPRIATSSRPSAPRAPSPENRGPISGMDMQPLTIDGDVLRAPTALSPENATPSPTGQVDVPDVIVIEDESPPANPPRRRANRKRRATNVHTADDESWSPSHSS